MFRFNSTLLRFYLIFVSCSTTRQEPTPSGPNGLRNGFDDGSTLNFGPDAGNLEARNSAKQ